MAIGMSSVRSLSLLRVQTSRESLARDQDMPSMTSSTSWLREMVQGMFPSLTRVQPSSPKYRNKITFIAWSPDDAGIQVHIHFQSTSVNSSMWNNTDYLIM